MALSLEPITIALDRVRGLFQREPKAMDAFGGDDLFDGDAKPASMGPKIALAISGVMFLALAGLVTAVVMTGDDAASTTGSLAGLEIEEEPSADDTAATDRSAERRPWLTSTQGGGRRLGVTEPATKSSDNKPTTDAKVVEPGKVAELPTTMEADVKDLPKVETLPTREVKTVEAMKPPPAGQDTQAAKKPEPAKTPTAETAKEPVKMAETSTPAAEAPKTTSDLLAQVKSAATESAKTPTVAPPTAAPTTSPPAPAAVTPPPATAPDVAAVAKAPEETKAATPTQVAALPQPSTAMPMADAKDEDEEEPKTMPSLLAPAALAPGAPRRVETADISPTAATGGGRPRLNDPALPPTEKINISAPPPRFAALTEIKVDSAAGASAAKVAVVVEGLGLNRAATEAALAKLPPSVTLAFSPYARDLKRWMDRAKQKGHEVLIEVPMEGKTFPAEDPGPLGLMTNLDDKDNQERLDTILKEAAGATGIFDATGSKFRESDSQISGVFARLKELNLFYVQGRPGVRVGEAGIPSATTDVVIDERPFRASVDARFDFAERLAKYQGSAVAVMSARPVSFERLALWVDQLPKKGVSLAPVSQVLVQ